jgi:hypothetical protein
MASMATDPDRVTKLRALLEKEPNDGFLLYALAQELAKLGRTDEAVAHYDPKECYAFFHKAKVLEEARRVPEAVAALRAGLARARAVGDRKASSEIEGYLDQLE